VTRATRAAFLVALAASMLSCSGEKPAPSQAARESSPPTTGGIKPLTSRDEAKPFAGVAPSTGELPVGHPPVGDAASGAKLAGIVSIAPGLLSRVSPKDVLYLIARNRKSNAVVAVRREDDVRFPHAFELSAKDAMTPDQPFVGPFAITARLSKSGDALPARGDLEGTSADVPEGGKNVAVLIERVRE
jgi:cytochrome c-type biogenesis protein CcmH